MRTWRFLDLGRAGCAAVILWILIAAQAGLASEKTVLRERIAESVRASARMDVSSKEWLHLQLALFPLKRLAGETESALRAHQDALFEAISERQGKAGSEEFHVLARCNLEVDRPEQAEAAARLGGGPPGYLEIAQYYLRAARLEDCRRVVDLWREPAPEFEMDRSYSLAMLAACAATNKQPALAKEWFAEALAIADNLPAEMLGSRPSSRIGARCEVAVVQERAGLSREARATVEEAVRRFKTLHAAGQMESCPRLFETAVNIGAFDAAADVLRRTEESARATPARAPAYAQMRWQTLAQAQGELGDIEGAMRRVKSLADQHERQRTIYAIAEFHCSAHNFALAEKLLPRLASEASRDGLRQAIAAGHAEAGNQKAARRWIEKVKDAERRAFAKRHVAIAKPRAPVPMISRARRFGAAFCATDALEEHSFAILLKSNPRIVLARLNGPNREWDEAHLARQIGRSSASADAAAVEFWRATMPSNGARAYFYLGLAEGAVEPANR